MTPYLRQLKTYLNADPRRAALILFVTVTLSIFSTWSVAYGLFSGKIQTMFSTVAHDTRNTTETAGSGNAGPQTSHDSQNSPDNSAPTQEKNNTATSPIPTIGATGSGTTKNAPTKNSNLPVIALPINRISLRNIIPQHGSVLTLSGLNYNITNYVPNAFGGIFNRPPYSLSKVNYPASLAKDSISTGVINLNSALRSTPGQKIVLAHSQGAQVASHWMRQYANDPTAPGANDVTFILFGNPLRSTGGYIIGRGEVGGTIGQPTPTNTKWPIVDVARRYDGWADWVQNQNNQWAVDNATAGRRSVHPHYEQVDIYASTNTVWQSGNTTYILTKEDTLPLWDDNSQYPLGVRSAMRAYIETAYVRPANDPKTTILPIESIDWENQLRSWGVPF